MKRTVLVTHEVVVEINETKFTPEWMRSFREVFYNFHTLDDHIAHLGQLYARGFVNDGGFIEGYGVAGDMGIKLRSLGWQMDVEKPAPGKKRSTK